MPPNLKRGIDTPRPDKGWYCGLMSVPISSDEYCPHCDNHFVLEAVTPKATLQVEGDDVRMDNRYAEGYKDSRFVANANNWVGCSRMTGYVVTKKNLCSISVMCPTEWGRERSFVALIFMKLTTLLHFPHFLRFYRLFSAIISPRAIDQGLHSINTHLCSNIHYWDRYFQECPCQMCRNFVVLSSHQVKRPALP
jgi:hypothetical protein